MSFKPTSPPSKKLEPHPHSKLMPPMSQEEIDALATDIGQNGVLQPIVIYQGKILDGVHRYQILASAYAFKKPVSFVEFEGTDAEAKAYVVSANLHRRHLTLEKRRELIAMLLKADPTKGNRLIAETAKVDDKTVAVVRSDLEATAEIPQLEKTVGKDGKSRTTKKTGKKKTDKQSVQVRYKAKQEELIDVLQEFTSVEHAEEYANLTKQRLDQTIANWTETAEAA